MCLPCGRTHEFLGNDPSRNVKLLADLQKEDGKVRHAITPGFHAAVQGGFCYHAKKAVISGVKRTLIAGTLPILIYGVFKAYQENRIAEPDLFFCYHFAMNRDIFDLSPVLKPLGWASTAPATKVVSKAIQGAVGTVFGYNTVSLEEAALRGLVCASSPFIMRGVTVFSRCMGMITTRKTGDIAILGLGIDMAAVQKVAAVAAGFVTLLAYLAYRRSVANQRENIQKEIPVLIATLHNMNTHWSETKCLASTMHADELSPIQGQARKIQSNIAKLREHQAPVLTFGEIEHQRAIGSKAQQLQKICDEIVRIPIPNVAAIPPSPRRHFVIRVIKFTYATTCTAVKWVVTPAAYVLDVAITPFEATARGIYRLVYNSKVGIYTR